MAKSSVVEFESQISRCCGLDIHKKEIVATVEGVDLPKETRTFSSTTRSLTELKEWLLTLGVCCDGEYGYLLETRHEHS